MKPRAMNLLWRGGVALSLIMAATVITTVLWQFHFPGLPRLVPFLFLVAILASSWIGGYVAGVTSVVVASLLGLALTRRSLDLTQIEYFRVFLLLLLSCAVSWIEAHG